MDGYIVSSAAPRASKAMQTYCRFLISRIGALAGTVLLGGLLTAVLVRVSPGFLVDERELDPRLSEASRASIEQEHSANRDVLAFYIHRLGRMAMHADLGDSPSLNRPIAQLLRERFPVTLQLMAAGMAGGWTLAFLLALPSVMYRSRLFRGLAGSFHQVLMSLPAAAMAVLVFDWGGPVRALVALVICPRVFEYIRNLLEEAYAQPHIVTARAKGLGDARILLRHVLPSVAPQMLALAGVSVSMAFGAAIPVESLCDLPGIGQLAWKAAMARDLPLLVTITLMVVVMTQACNMVSDWVSFRERQT
ncbi:MAG: ABC transporter permease [Bryobacteraceae bacterium]|jgi:peptide/nickel transport system permease protein